MGSKFTEKPLDIVYHNKGLEDVEMSLWHLQNTENISFNKERKITQEWLMRKAEQMELNFGYFITLSFYKQTDNPITQYLDNQHIRKVILDFLYPHKKPKNRIRLWFFIEQHKSGLLHLHFLMEKVDYLSWLSSRNRKIILHKTTLFNVISNEYSLEDLFIEALTNHLKEWVNKLGRGRKSTKIKHLGKMEKRIHYLNKSLDFNNLDFDKWQHIDFENSDIDKPIKQQTK